MCLQSRRINHSRGSRPPKTEMLVRYIMYFEHSNIMFFQKKNFAVKIMIIILRIYDINIIIIMMMMMRGLADPTRLFITIINIIIIIIIIIILSLLLLLFKSSFPIYYTRIPASKATLDH